MRILFRPLKTDVAVVAAMPDLSRMPIGAVCDGDSVERRYEEMVLRWARIHGLDRSDLRPVADMEDWTENAVQLIAAVETGLPVSVIGPMASPTNLDVTRILNGDGGKCPNAPAIFLGSRLRWDPVLSSGRTDAAAAPSIVWPIPSGLGRVGPQYWEDPTLRRALGRLNVVSGGNADGPNGYVAATRRLIAEGARRVIAKIIFQAKYQQPTEIRLPEGPDPSDEAIRDAFVEAFDVNLLDCDGRERCFLIQELRPLVCEYRVVVVDGVPTAGAGAVEWLCPLFHDPAAGPFDDLMEMGRNGMDLARRPGVVRRYLDMAEGICSSFRVRSAEGRDVERFLNCTLDFALDDGTGDAVLVEANPLDSFGLYAMDFGPVMRAIVERCRLRQAPSPSMTP